MVVTNFSVLGARRAAWMATLTLIAWTLTLCAGAWADALRVLGVSVDPASGAVVIQCNRPLEDYNRFTTLRLTAPYRYVVDLPDASLAAPATTQRPQRGGIASIQAAQNRSLFYSAVRVVITVDSAELLERLQLKPDGKALLVGGFPAPSAPPQSVSSGATTPPPAPANIPAEIPPGMTAITDIFYRDGQLYLISDPTRPERIQMKNRFRLSAPARLVMDLDQAVLGSRDLAGAIRLPAGAALQSIRVGQFDERTVRVVVETSQPDRVNIAFPGADQRTMTVALGPDDRNMNQLPKDAAAGSLERITLDPEKNGATLRLVSTSPAIYRLTRRGDRIQIELLNIAARAGDVGFDRGRFPQIAQMRVEPLSSGQPNSKFILMLEKDAKWDARAQQDPADPRAITLSLAPAIASARGVYTGGSGMMKAPFPARVVLDAGHGGKDQGAERSGILEKDLNLSVALKVREALEARGVKVTMTRDSDRFLELRQITEINNRVNPDLFVSVHHNASVNPSIYGIETYYYTPQSRLLADNVHAKLINRVGAPDRGVRKAMFYVIHHTQTPAILCEVGYVSNPQELREAASEARQQAEANAIADGVVAYLHSRLAADAR